MYIYIYIYTHTHFFFLSPSLHKCKILHCLELVYSKNYFNLPEIFLLRLFKMVTNQKIEQKSIMKVLLAEKCKPCEIYCGLCDMHGKECFNHRNLYKQAKHWFASMSLSGEDTSLMFSQ